MRAHKQQLQLQQQQPLGAATAAAAAAAAAASATNLNMLSKTQKLILGVIVLLLVDIIWVSSSELTKFLYEDAKFDKPFFCTYFKTSMFTIYLIVIGLITPWKESCSRQNANYALMDQTIEDDNYYSNQAALSDSMFIPIHSGTESDDSSIRSVHFNKIAEVREMSAHEATEMLMARLSYAASMRIQRQKTHHKTAKTALLFCVLWFFANYLFQLSLEMGETAMVTLLSSSSCFFTLILAAFFPSATGDKFTLAKLIAVMMNIGGVVTVTISDVHDSKFSRGALLALFSAFFYASYLVFVKRKSDTEEKVDIPLFFGFVGLWNMLLMWPIFFILNFLKIEKFELPNQNQFAILFLNGLIGTVISEALWLWGCFLTSSLIGTIALSMQIPLSIIFDVFLKNKPYKPLFYAGSIPIFLALMLLAALMRNDDADPLMRLMKLSYRKLCNCRKPNIVRINDEEQQESLINSND